MWGTVGSREMRRHGTGPTLIVTTDTGGAYTCTLRSLAVQVFARKEKDRALDMVLLASLMTL